MLPFRWAHSQKFLQARRSLLAQFVVRGPGVRGACEIEMLGDFASRVAL